MRSCLQEFGGIVALLRAVSQQLRGWSLQDLSLGVHYVWTRHEAHNVCDNLPGKRMVQPPADEPGLYVTLHTEVELAHAAYAAVDRSLLASAENCIIERAPHLRKGSVKLVRHAAACFKPAHFVAVDVVHKAIRVVIRGTDARDDLLTDLASKCAPYAGGSVHDGIFRSAHWLLAEEEFAALLANLLQAHRGCVSNPSVQACEQALLFTCQERDHG